METGGRMTEDPDAQARRLARESLAADDATGWFERLYAAAGRGDAVVPWDRGRPQPLLAEWAQARHLDSTGRRAIVVGCGPGYDAEYVAGLGFSTVAFDIAESAVKAARERFPASPVEYVTANLLAPPGDWVGAFDLVVECLTVQSLPDPLRPGAIRQVGRLVAPGGTLLVVAAARDESEPAEGRPPWPLTRAELESFAHGELTIVGIEDLYDAEREVRRWRAEFARPSRPPM
jgi:SAM-dependent methyltransferase